jgi:hypothetical protein
MLTVALRADRIHVGERFSLSLQRTLRIPDDGRTYPLPPGLEALPVHRVADFAERLPKAWRVHGGFFVPLYQREALWLQFEAAPWKPNAVKVGVGGVNALTGADWTDELTADPQNYLVSPSQPWLDGIHTGEGTVRQFVAATLGLGDTVEEQLTGVATVGGIQIQVLEPVPGRFPDHSPPHGGFRFESMEIEGPAADALGIAAGGQLRQKIYPDPYGIATWDQGNSAIAFVHLVNSAQYRGITGQEPPPSPVTAELYAQLGLPWFALYDEDRDDVPPSERLARVESLKERDLKRGADPDPEHSSVTIDPSSIVTLDPKRQTDS